MYQFVLIFLMGFSRKHWLMFAAENKIIQSTLSLPCSPLSKCVAATFWLLFHVCIYSLFPAQVDLINQQQGDSFSPNHPC